MNGTNSSAKRCDMVVIGSGAAGHYVRTFEKRKDNPGQLADGLPATHRDLAASRKRSDA